MKRCAINEDAVFPALQPNDFYEIYDWTMFEMKQHPYLVYSPDAIALIHQTKISLTYDVHAYASVQLGQDTCTPSTVKINSVIAKSTIGNVF